MSKHSTPRHEHFTHRKVKNAKIFIQIRSISPQDVDRMHEFAMRRDQDLVTPAVLSTALCVSLPFVLPSVRIKTRIQLIFNSTCHTHVYIDAKSRTNQPNIIDFHGFLITKNVLSNLKQFIRMYSPIFQTILLIKNKFLSNIVCYLQRTSR